MKLTKKTGASIVLTAIWYFGWILYSNIGIGRSWNGEEIFFVSLATALPILLWGAAWITTLPSEKSE